MEQQNVDSPEEPPDEGEGPKTPEEIKDDVLELLSELDNNRSERGQINLDAAKGKAKARLTGEVADLNAEYEKYWGRVADILGAETAARLRVRFEPWRRDSSETAPAIDELYDEVVAPLPEYPHCACGARLVLDAETASGKCEACQPIAEAEVAGVCLPTTDGQPGAEPASASAPVDVPLPFPPAPVEPFDLAAAFEDIAKKNRGVEACRHTYEELKSRASDAKKAWEAAVTLVEQITSTYDMKYRAWLDAEERQVESERAYREKLEADAAKAAAPELPIAEAPTAEARVPDLAPATPLSDALPTCACGAALALDSELGRGTCDDCAWAAKG